MKKIKIFIASSVEELRAERQALGSFVTGLNNRLIDRGFFCQLSLCDNEDQAMPAGGRKQDEYNKIIADSDAVFVLFFKKAGSYTVEELDFARDCYRRSGHPKVYVYFKDFSEAELTDSARAVYDRIVNDYQHFFGTFENVATIEVDIMRTMFDITLEPSLEVREQGGVIYLGNEEIMSADELDYIQNNKSIEKLKAQIAGLRTGDPDYTDGLYGEEIDEEIEKCEKRLKERYDSCFRALEARYKSMANASRLDIELQAAYNASAKGDYKEVLNILSREKLQNETRKAVEEAKISQKRYLETTFNKYLQRISALDGLCDFAALEEAYDDAIGAIREMHLYEADPKVLDLWYNGISFFYRQSRTKKAIEYGEKLRGIYQLAFNEPNKYVCQRLYNLLGVLYYLQNDSKRAKDYYFMAVEILEELAVTDSDKYAEELAGCFHNIGVLCAAEGEGELAEECYLKAIEIREELAAQTPEKYGTDLADSYNGIGHFYKNQGEPKRAEEYYSKAVRIGEELADMDHRKYCGNLAMYYNSIGSFYAYLGELQRAELYLLRFIEIMEELVLENADRYGGEMAGGYYNIGYVYAMLGDTEKAEHYYMVALDMRKELVKKDPKRYSSDLASSYNNAGMLYMKIGNAERAEECYSEAIAISAMLATQAPERYSSDLAVAYYNYAIFKSSDEYFKKAYLLAKAALHHPLCRRIVDSLKEKFE